MDLEQLTKRVEWMDEERRKDKQVITTLEARLAEMENRLPALVNQVKELNSDLVRVNSLLVRFDQVDARLAEIEADTKRSLDAIEKARTERERENERVRYADLESLNKQIAEVRKGLEPIPEIRRSIQARMEEDFRLGRLIEEVEVKVLETRRSDEEYRRSQKLIEENQRQDSKRLTDVQGEVTAIRKRQDELRGRMDLLSDGVRKIEGRVGDVQAAENERRQAQVAFFDKINMAQVERERVWKEWQTRFETIEKQAVGLDAQLQALDATNRAIKRSQESFDEVTNRFNRRINEITEMQRLTEDRFRQEWVAYKADDQKRWANYSLIQEEHQREVTRQFEKYSERLVLLEDLTQEMQDLLHLINEEAEKRLQSLLALSRDWVDEHNQTFGGSSAV